MNLIARAFITASLLLSVACTEKGKPYHAHESARPTPSSENPLATPPSQAPSERSEGWDKTFSTTTPGPTRLQQLVAIAREVLSPDRVRDPRSLIERGRADELMVLNRLVLKISNEEKNLMEYRALVNLYSEVLMLDCSEFRDSCTGLRYFKLAANSEEVMKDFVKQRIPMNRVRMILIALDLKTRGVWDGELIEMLATLPTQTLTTQERADLVAAESLLNTAIDQANSRIQGQDEARHFLDQTQVWKLIGESPIRLTDATRLALFTLVGKAGYLQGQQNKTHPDLMKWMNKMKAHPESVFTKQARLNQQTLFSPEAIGAQAIAKYDEVTFLIDAVYTNTLKSDAAAILMKGLKRSNAEIATAVENYVRLQFLSALYDSSVMAHKIFSAPVATESLLRHAMNETAQVRSIWDTYSSRSNGLLSLTLNASKNLTDAERTKINGLFDSIPRTIKQASVYPHIMVLFYMMSQKRFELYIPILGRTLDTAKLTQWLWESKIGPLFPYSDDSTPLGYYEMIHAFDMAVRTNLFDSVHIDTDDFIFDTLRRLSEIPIAFMDKTLATVDLRRQETLSFRDFKGVCQELVDGKPYRRRTYFAELRTSSYYGKLKALSETSIASLNSDSSGFESGIAKNESGLFYPDSHFDETLESARLDLGTLERLGQTMVKSYSDFLRKYRGASPEKINSLTKKSREAIAALQKKRRSVFQAAQDYQKEFGFCYFKLALNDARKSETLLAYETQYLKHIHRRIKRMRTPGTSVTERDAILASTYFSGLPSAFTGYDRILDNGYRYSELDLKIRLAKYHMQGLDMGGEKLPAVSPHLEYTFGSKLDLDVKVVREAKTIFLPFVESEDEFAASGIRAIFQNGNHFLFWERNYSNIRDYFNSMISLYRAEYNINGRASITTAKAIVDDFQDIFDFMSMTPLRRQLLHQLRREAWETSMALLPYNFLFLRVNYDDQSRPFGALTSLWGLYDYLFSAMANEQLGFNLGSKEAGVPTIALPQREVLFSAGRNYFTSRSPVLRGHPVLPSNADLDKVMDENIGRFVRSELNAVHDFYSEILQRIELQKKLPPAQRPRVDLTTKMSITDWFSPSTASDFGTREMIFHQQTDNTFR